MLPGTPWTGFMCAGMSMLMMVYFASCLVEWYGDRGERTNHAAVERLTRTLSSHWQREIGNRPVPPLLRRGLRASLRPARAAFLKSGIR